MSLGCVSPCTCPEFWKILPGASPCPVLRPSLQAPCLCSQEGVKGGSAGASRGWGPLISRGVQTGGAWGGLGRSQLLQTPPKSRVCGSQAVAPVTQILPLCKLGASLKGGGEGPGGRIWKHCEQEGTLGETRGSACPSFSSLELGAGSPPGGFEGLREGGKTETWAGHPPTWAQRSSSDRVAAAVGAAFSRPQR